MKSVDDLFARLRDNEKVAGLIRYGSAPALADYQTGDLDLFVVLSGEEPRVESLHFDVKGLPVDLNLLTLAGLKSLEPSFTFPAQALRRGVIVFDRSGVVGAALNRLETGFAKLRPQVPSAHAVSFMRHGHRHLLDKLRGRLETEPLLANLLLNTNIHWLLESYFRLRGLPFGGERRALAYLREHEAELYGQLEAFYKTDDLAAKVEITEVLTAQVLGPVGGAWRRGEVLAFGRDELDSAERLAQQGARLYRDLFGEGP